MSNLKSLLVIGLLGAHAFVAYEAQAGDAVATAPTKAQKTPSSLRVTFPAQTSTTAHDNKDWIHVESYTLGSTQATPRASSSKGVARYNLTEAWPSAAPTPRMPPTVTMKRGTSNAGE